MEVAKGYKKTEGGIIPEDWNSKKIGQVLKVMGGGAFKSSDSKESGVKWLKIANVGINETIWNEEDFLPPELIKNNENLLLKEGDYVVALTRPILDRKLKIARLNFNDVPALLNQRVGKICIEEGNDVNFSYFVFQKYETINALLQSMAGTDPPNLSNKGIYNIDCATPPTKAEQTAIATALSDADALITSLEKLIAKKRNIKQGAMQQLLKPKKGWEKKWLGNCLVRNPDYGINAASVPYNESLPTYLRITDISEDGKYLANDKVSVDNIASNAFYLEDGDIVFARTGASVGKTYLYNVKDGKLVFAGFLIRVKVNKTILDPKYLFYITQTKSYWSWVIANSMRSGQPGLNSNEYKSLQIQIPTIEIQKEIISVLSDMDSEISALESKLEKYRKIKSGMMQNLLTGKIRLV